MFVLNFYEKCYVKLNNECVFLFSFFFLCVCTNPVQQERFDKGTCYGYMIYAYMYSMYVHGVVCMYVAMNVCIMIYVCFLI